MGKRIISQRRGKGSPTYKAHSYRWKAKIEHRKYDDIEKSSVIAGKIINIRHNKGFNAPVAIIKYANNDQSFIFAPENVRVNEEVQSGAKASIKTGNTLPLKNIPEGTLVYNLELCPGDGGKLCRSPGISAKILAIKEELTVVALPSKKQKEINSNCRATIGTIAGQGIKEKPLVKAGKTHYIMRAKGKLYPRTSGVAMNAVDHPFGSGRGRQHAKVKSPSRFAPPGRKVGPIGARRTGRKR